MTIMVYLLFIWCFIVKRFFKLDFDKFSHLFGKSKKRILNERYNIFHENTQHYQLSFYNKYHLNGYFYCSCRLESCDLQLGDTWRGMQDKMSVTASAKKIRKKSDNKPQSQMYVFYI